MTRFEYDTCPRCQRLVRMAGHDCGRIRWRLLVVAACRLTGDEASARSHELTWRLPTEATEI
jgi:hypothetical protein